MGVAAGGGEAEEGADGEEREDLAEDFGGERENVRGHFEVVSFKILLKRGRVEERRD